MDKSHQGGFLVKRAQKTEGESQKAEGGVALLQWQEVG